MILLSSPLKYEPPENMVSIFFFLEIEIITTKIVNSKSLKKSVVSFQPRLNRSDVKLHTPDKRQSVSHSSIKGGLKIFCLNINSLTRHLDEIRIFIEDKQPHILCLNETKIDDSISDDDIEIEGYIVNRKDRNRFGGGVAIYIHNTIQFTYVRT